MFFGSVGVKGLPPKTLQRLKKYTEKNFGGLCLRPAMPADVWPAGTAICSVLEYILELLIG